MGSLRWALEKIAARRIKPWIEMGEIAKRKFPGGRKFFKDPPEGKIPDGLGVKRISDRRRLEVALQRYNEARKGS